jgi:glycosyltransferase involved in cell wall biosynthesis
LLGDPRGEAISLERVATVQRQGCRGAESGEQFEEAVLKARAERRLSITVLMCTLNEEESLPHVLPRIPDWVDEVLLVDGHSTDNTVAVAKGLRPDVRVLYQSDRGKGDALKCGVEHASGDIVVTLDADGETDPQEIPKFVEPLLRGYDFVKGARLAKGRPLRMPRYRWLGNKILALTYNILYGTRYADICSGYSAFWKRAFLQVELTYDNCEMEQQLLVRAKKAGLKIAEVAHLSHGRIAGASKINGISQGFIDWLVVIKERFRG